MIHTLTFLFLLLAHQYRNWALIYLQMNFHSKIKDTAHLQDTQILQKLRILTWTTRAQKLFPRGQIEQWKYYPNLLWILESSVWIYSSHHSLLVEVYKGYPSREGLVNRSWYHHPHKSILMKLWHLMCWTMSAVK